MGQHQKTLTRELVLLSAVQALPLTIFLSDLIQGLLNIRQQLVGECKKEVLDEFS